MVEHACFSRFAAPYIDLNLNGRKPEKGCAAALYQFEPKKSHTVSHAAARPPGTPLGGLLKENPGSAA